MSLAASSTAYASPYSEDQMLREMKRIQDAERYPTDAPLSELVLGGPDYKLFAYLMVNEHIQAYLEREGKPMLTFSEAKSILEDVLGL